MPYDPTADPVIVEIYDDATAVLGEDVGVLVEVITLETIGQTSIEVGLQGPKGDPGADGADGAAGPTGSTGPTGPAGISVVHHGTNPATARPSNPVVYWIGTATPANAVAWDLWLKENI